MARDRLSLHNKLLSLLGNPNVYYQPPSTITLKYPCIIYKLDDVEGVHANNSKYWGTRKYLITLVSKTPDPTILDDILALPLSKFEDPLVVDNLYQYVCSLHW